jgi:hypothetical protein
VHLHNSLQCEISPTGECFWDANDQRCKSAHCVECVCGALPYNLCSSNPSCLWDAAD